MLFALYCHFSYYHGPYSLLPPPSPFDLPPSPSSLALRPSSLALRPFSLAPLGPFTLTLSLCIPKWILPSTNVGLCCYLFYVSKYVELLDTAFLLLRNKPVRFVQKWHHVSVLYLFWSYMQVRERERERDRERESVYVPTLDISVS